MLRTLQAVLALHVVGFALWVGGLVAACRLLRVGRREADAGARARLAGAARKVALVPDLGATLAIACGAWMLVKLEAWREPWMHIKLTLVAVTVGLHGLCRVKAWRAARGEGGLPAFVLPLLAVVAAGIVALAVFKAPSRGG